MLSINLSIELLRYAKILDSYWLKLILWITTSNQSTLLMHREVKLPMLKFANDINSY